MATHQPYQVNVNVADPRDHHYHLPQHHHHLHHPATSEQLTRTATDKTAPTTDTDDDQTTVTTTDVDNNGTNLKAMSTKVLRSSLSLFRSSRTAAAAAATTEADGSATTEDEQQQRQQMEVDTITPYMVGFAIGWCTWLFGSVLGLFAGRGKRAGALRKGLFVGAVAVTLPFLAIMLFVWFLINKWNAFLDKFDLF